MQIWETKDDLLCSKDCDQEVESRVDVEDKMVIGSKTICRRRR